MAEDMSSELIAYVIFLAIGIALYAVINALLAPLLAVDATGTPTAEGMTNATVSIFGIVPLVVAVLFLVAAVVILKRHM